MDQERDQDQPGDLSALAWVNDELRRTLDNVHKTLRRHLREVEGHEAGDPAVVSTTPLLQARGLYHQGVGALELIGLDEPSRFLAACEQAVQRLALGGVPFTAEAVNTLERASFGLLDYLRRLLSSRPVAALALFPQYKAVLTLAGADRVHPADLWSVKPVIADDRPDDGTHALPPTQLRQRIEGALLEFFRSGDLGDARGIGELFQSLVAHADGRLATLWPMAAAFFEAQGAGLLPVDVYAKRMASRLLTQLRRAEAGQTDCPDRLFQDLLFFCARSSQDESSAPLLAAVCRVHGIKPLGEIDYDHSPLGRFDPALIPVARRRVTNLKESWSALASGELATLSGVVEQGALVVDSIRQLYPDGELLAKALQHAFARASAASVAPKPELSMEVATTLLCLEASLDDGDLDQPQLQERVSRLAERLDTVANGLPPQPLEPWVEDLYRQVSDRQAMGSVVQELRSSLAEIEQQLDRFARNPGDVDALRPVPGQLSAMRGVLAVLGLDQATQAIHRMREDISQLMVSPAAGVPPILADNLGAMSFLIDMLGVQPQLARTLFRFDSASGGFAPVMGQIRKPAPVSVAEVPAVDAAPLGAMSPAQPELAVDVVPDATGLPERVLAPAVANVAVGGWVEPSQIVGQAEAIHRGVITLSPDDQEMRDIFLEEAREVIEQVNGHLAQVTRDPEDHATLTAIRRGFHTLKGSARMVGLRALGEVAWSGEQLFNARLADADVRADAALLRYAADAIAEFASWIDEIAELGHDEGRDAGHLIQRARVLRLGEDAAPSLASVPVGPMPPLAVVAEELETPASVATDVSPVALPAEPLLAVEAHVEDLDFVHTMPGGMEGDELHSALSALAPAITVLPTDAAEPVNPALAAELPSNSVGTGTVDGDDWGDLSIEWPAESASPDSAVSEEFEDLVALDVPLLADEVADLELPSEAEPATASVNSEGADSAPELAIDFPLERDTVIEPEAVSLGTPDVAPVLDFDFGGEDVVDALAAVVVTESAVGGENLSAGEEGLMQVAEVVVPEPFAAEAELEILSVEAEEDWPVIEGEVVASSSVAPEWEPIEVPQTDATPWDQVEVVEPAVSEAMLEEGPDAPGMAVDLPGGAADSGLPAVTWDAPVEQEPRLDADDDGYKLVGSLRIPIALFNIYLNEADEQSRRLCTALAEWQHEFYRAVGESPIALAHSLAGNSATVGHRDLSALARRLEHALEHSRARGAGSLEDALLFVEAAEEIRRLLHQFAAGFLKTVSDDVLRRFDVHEAQNAEQITHAADLDMPADLEDEALPVLPSANAEPAAALSDADDLIQPLPVLVAPVVALEPVKPAVTASVVNPRNERRGDFGGFDEGLEAVDAVDPELFAIFDEEGQELLPALAEHLRDWESDPEGLAAGVAAMRALHTFKGGARLAGAMRLGELAHRLETAIEHVTARGDVPDAKVLAQLQNGVDALDDEFQRLRQGDALPTDDVGPLLDASDPAGIAEPSYESPAAFAEPVAWSPLEPVAVAVRVEEAAAEAVVAATPSEVPANEVVSLIAEASTHAPAALDVTSLNAAGVEGEPSSGLAPVVPNAVVAAAVIDWTRFMRPASSEVAAVAGAVDGANASVRVRAQLLDRLVSHAGEVGIARARIESDMSQMQTALRELTDNLERLRRQLRDLELQAETQMTNRIEAARHAHATFDPLEMDRFTRVQELTRMMAESVNDVGTVQRGLQQTLQSTDDQLAAQARLTRDLQDDLLRARMVEFDTLSDRLYRVVRQAAKESNKQVRLNLEGGGIELDRAVLDRMAQAFEHLLRNAVVHGIESSARREAAHKPAIGTVEVRLQQMGNEVQIEVRDDGAGLNLARIAERARAQGLLAPGVTPNESELAGMIFRPGFTTVEEVTELAGRGVGMDVVRAEVTAMGGRIETATTSGQGTAFRMVLPLTTAVTQVVVLTAGEVTFAVPSTLVELVKRVPLAEAEAAYQSGSLTHGQQQVPFFWAGSLLQHGLRGTIEGRTAQVVIIRSAAQYVALHVDQVQGNQEVVVKNLGPQLSRLPGLAGISVLATGSTVLIYNPVALAAVYGGQIRQQAATALAAQVARSEVPTTSVAVSAPVATASEANTARELPLVMVIDDSLTVRRVTQRLLQREGFRVLLAKDGLEALELLQVHRPAVMLCDIEMPRMDGFDLVRNVRGDARLADIPVIMITSRIAQKHQDHARELGVDHYLGKPYDEERLLGLVRTYAEAGVTA